MPAVPDVAVIGAGVLGAWTAHHLRAAGLQVTLVEAFGAGHARASSGGESRILRAGYGDRTRYAQWAHASRPQWTALLAAAGRPHLFVETGVLWLGPADDPHLDATTQTLDRLGIAAAPLGRAALAARYPQIGLDGVARGLIEPAGGAILARRAVGAVVDDARRRGVDVRDAAAAAPADGAGRLDAIALGGGASLAAGAFVFACGPWLPALFPRLLGPRLRTTRQEVWFFGPPPGDGRFRPPALPAWIDFHGGAYGLPDLEGRGVKIAGTAPGPPFDPDRGDRTPSPDGLAAARRILARRLPALADAPLVEARVCQYTTTPGGDLLIDRHPDRPNVWLVGGGSGHGFKLGPAVGAYAASQVTGAAPPDPGVGLAALDDAAPAGAAW